MYSLGVSSIGLGPAPRLVRRGVEFQVEHPQHRALELLRPAAQRLHPRQQLLEGERLGDVVVSAGAQRLHLEVDRVLGRQHEDRHGEPAVAQVAQHLEPGHLRQPQVEDDEVVLPTGGEAQALESVRGEIDVEALFLESALHVLPDGTVVLDRQDLHASVPGDTVGRKTRKTLPPPEWLSTSMRPRCSSTMP